ncbi:hypothetical protein [Roseomonas sp. BN140053]|uniref:hypothetical protein n=1 Tax=Roseomonas sp. BN140053 TaxID=3391898 RepID=UPI0039E7EE23
MSAPLPRRPARRSPAVLADLSCHRAGRASHRAALAVALAPSPRDAAYSFAFAVAGLIDAAPSEDIRRTLRTAERTAEQLVFLQPDAPRA